MMCDGNPVTLELVTREAVVGEALGEAPDGVPIVPLDTDLRGAAPAPSVEVRGGRGELILDLRKPGDLAKSQLLRLSASSPFRGAL